jgi:formate hydrogenlyase subunit 3/multisubunit Na+/H+ antiporter MnhD subunit
MSVASFLCIPAALLALGVIALPMARRPWASGAIYGASCAVAAAGLAIALLALVDSDRSARHALLPLGIPWLGAHFRIDKLAAFFLVIVNLGGGVASLCAIGYGRHEEAPERVLPFYPAFLAAMNLVVLADDAFTFLLSWEFMSLASWALVMSHHRERENARAGYVYIVMASFGTLSLLLALGLLAGQDGAYAFDQMRSHQHSPALASLALLLVLLGAGSKAGLVPLHAWLPLAHPAAPSHVSALMSGVMTKVAIYGFIRIGFDLLGEPAWWWSSVLLVLGGATAALGVLYALMQTDLKRLLAYSTVENVGIVFIALGLAMAFRANNIAWAAALALTAALLHAFNHSLFKSVLFFGSGAVLDATGTRDIERLGGLIHRMPKTALSFLVGSAAISALPPLNGFVSEWLTFQSILVSPQLPQWGLRFLVPAIGAILALSAALAAACFVRAFGIAFLGRPRAEAAANAHEVDRYQTFAMLAVAALCLLAGVVPGAAIDALAPVTTTLVGERMPEQLGVAWLSLVPIVESRSSYNGLTVFAFVVVSAGAALFAIRWLGNAATRRSPAWDCGFPDPNPMTQYTGGSFAQPLRRVFGTLVFRAREKVTMPPPGDPSPARLAVEQRDLIWDGLYLPVAGGVRIAADRLNHLQFLTIRRYLSLVFGALITLLVVLAIWQ